jgi:hypothetical protein
MLCGQLKGDPRDQFGEKIHAHKALHWVDRWSRDGSASRSAKMGRSIQTATE